MCQEQFAIETVMPINIISGWFNSHSFILMHIEIWLFHTMLALVIDLEMNMGEEIQFE